MENCTTVIWIKNGLYIPAFLMAIGFPEQASWGITALAVLMTIDFATGILASIKIDGPHAITSRKMTAGIVAKSLILLIPFMFVIAGRGTGINTDALNNAILNLLILAEIYSVVGNIYSFRVGKRLPESDVISMVLSKIRGTILNLLEKSKID